MRFALFGDEAALFAVARAVAASPGHEITHIVGEAQSAPPLSSLGRNLQYCRSWEELLSDAGIDAVIVWGSGEEVQQAVRQIVVAGKKVLLPPSLTQPPPVFYELALIEAENPGSLFPLLGLRGHALVLKLRDLILHDGLGRLRHARLERMLTPSSPGPSSPGSSSPGSSSPGTGSLLHEEDLARALLVDADLLRTLCGAFDQVTALRSGDAERGFSLATVTLAGGSAPQAVWTAAAGGENTWRLTLTGEEGTALLEGHPDRAWFHLTVNREGLPPIDEAQSDDAATWLVEQFSRDAARRLPADDENVESNAPPVGSFWEELARDVELVDAVERSVRRRRTIDVYFDTPSERGIFKTQMTAVGCCLLMLTPAGIVVYLAVAANVALPPLVKQIIVALLFLPLGLFLALQLLLFISRPASRDAR
jgi:predicted dehydrogenase